MLIQPSEEFVKMRVMEWLGRHDYVIMNAKTLAEHGADVRAKKSRSANYFIIECKGDPKTNPDKMRYCVLVSALGEIVQRITKKHTRYAIALPYTYERHVRRKIPWVAAKKLGLEILLVSSIGKIDRLNWRTLRKVKD